MARHASRCAMYNNLTLQSREARAVNAQDILLRIIGTQDLQSTVVGILYEYCSEMKVAR